MPITAPHVDQYTLGKGRVYFNPWDTNDVPQGERFLGNCPSFTLSVESEKLDHISSKSGIGEKDDSATLSLTRTAAITCDNVTLDNYALFVIGDKSTKSVSSGSVTDEVIGPIVATDRYHQIGELSGTPAGLRNLTSVDAVSVKEGDDASSWSGTTAYALGAVVVPTTPNSHWYMATTAGTSGAGEPTWPTNGTTVVDGTVTWQDMGLIALVEDTDFQTDLPLGRLYIMTTGAIATFIPLLPAGITVNLNVDYTRSTTSWGEVASSSLTATTGSMRFVADNPKGANQDAFLPKVEVSPSGELQLISGEDWATVGFDVEVLTKDDSTSQVYIDGRAA